MYIHIYKIARRLQDLLRYLKRKYHCMKYNFQVRDLNTITNTYVMWNMHIKLLSQPPLYWNSCAKCAFSCEFENDKGLPHIHVLCDIIAWMRWLKRCQCSRNYKYLNGVLYLLYCVLFAVDTSRTMRKKYSESPGTFRNSWQTLHIVFWNAFRLINYSKFKICMRTDFPIVVDATNFSSWWHF